jgi:hypothetical protein
MKYRDQVWGKEALEFLCVDSRAFFRFNLKVVAEFKNNLMVIYFYNTMRLLCMSNPIYVHCIIKFVITLVAIVVSQMIPILNHP